MIGTSVIRRFSRSALTTISEANSMPCVRRCMRSRASRVKARIPQWESETHVWKKSRSMPESTGLPMNRCVHGMAPGRIVPVRRLPMTMSAAPAASGATKRPRSAKS